MGSNKAGFINEDNLIYSLNNKKVRDLNENLKEFIYFLFENINDNDQIFAFEGKYGQKPDMIIKVRDITKNISIKIGSGNSVHQENISLFTNFLNSIGIPQELIFELLKFHWADNTINGTGKKRLSSADYKQEHFDKIILINKEINKSIFLDKFVNRFLFQGKSFEYDIVDVIYYGNSVSGHWATKDEIINYINSTKFNSDSVHFGPLNYQIWNRCLNFNPNTENRRQVMQIKWPTLLQDILNIERKRK